MLKAPMAKIEAQGKEAIQLFKKAKAKAKNEKKIAKAPVKELQDKHEVMSKCAQLVEGALNAKQDNRGNNKKRLIAELFKFELRVKEGR